MKVTEREFLLRIYFISLYYLIRMIAIDHSNCRTLAVTVMVAVVAAAE